MGQESSPKLPQSPESHSDTHTATCSRVDVTHTRHCPLKEPLHSPALPLLAGEHLSSDHLQSSASGFKQAEQPPPELDTADKHKSWAIPGAKRFLLFPLLCSCGCCPQKSQLRVFLCRMPFVSAAAAAGSQPHTQSLSDRVAHVVVQKDIKA